MINHIQHQTPPNHKGCIAPGITPPTPTPPNHKGQPPIRNTHTWTPTHHTTNTPHHKGQCPRQRTTNTPTPQTLNTPNHKGCTPPATRHKHQPTNTTRHQ